MNVVSIALLAVSVLVIAIAQSEGSRRFYVSNNQFYKDGSPLQIISGSVFYQRIPKPYWRDRLERIKSMGLNTVETYVIWQNHEHSIGTYTWSGRNNLAEFILLAQELGLLVQLRLGPYMAGEWGFGGLPTWLARNEYRPVHNYMQLRSDDPHYLVHVERWYNVLLPEVVRPLLYHNGGPVIMVQMENEYSYCVPSYTFERGQRYLQFLLKLLRQHLGPDIVIYTTDPPSTIDKGGTLPGSDVISAVDFGPGWFKLEEAFGAADRWNAPGMSPPLCTELYTGWMTGWSDKPPAYPAEGLLREFNAVLSYANGTGSVSLYVVHGGTNFGHGAGAHHTGTSRTFKPFVTSYDYEAPVAEDGSLGLAATAAGEPPSKFTLLRQAIEEHTGDVLPPPPAEPLTRAYGDIALGDEVQVLDRLAQLAFPHGGLWSERPKFMEEYHQLEGPLIAYSTMLPADVAAAGGQLKFKHADYAKVFLDKELVAETNRTLPPAVDLPPHVAADGQKEVELTIAVVVMGHGGGCWWDWKGILGDGLVELNDKPLEGWKVFPLPMGDVGHIGHRVWPDLYQPSAGFATVDPHEDAVPQESVSVPQHHLNGGDASATAADKATGKEGEQDGANDGLQVQHRRTLKAGVGFLQHEASNVLQHGPTFYRGTLHIPHGTKASGTNAGGYLPCTWLDPSGWGRGMVWVNGFLLGWYWPTAGYQVTLYVPGSVLREGINDIVLLEVDAVPQEPHISFVAKPDWSGPTLVRNTPGGS